jgi:pimeloyl-ACP methyl ester carboxylesterase
MRLMSVPGLNRLLVKMMVPNSLEKARELPTFMGHPKEVGANWPEAMAGCSYQFPRLPTFETAWLSLMERVLDLRGAKPDVRLGEEALKRVQQPALFIWGSQDPFGSLEVAQRAQEAVPDATLHEVGVGHLPWWDDADKCAGLIRGFLSKEAQ